MHNVYCICMVVHYIEKLMAHVREMEGYRFDLMRMYKHKPNYKIHRDVQECGCHGKV